MVCLASPLACTILVPPGYPLSDDREPTTIYATPWVAFGTVPHSWDLPDGRQILFDVSRADLTFGFGLYRADIAFSVSLDGHRLRCESEPSGPNVPKTRFGCWSGSPSSNELTFWLGKDQDCPARDAAHVKTLTTPECWDGELTFRGQRISMWHGILKNHGSPVGYVSWGLDPKHVLLSADIVGNMQVLLYGSESSVSPDLARNLILLTMALHQWEHQLSPD